MKSVGMTTGAFYGCYKSKEELFEAIVGEHYEYILKRFIKAQQDVYKRQFEPRLQTGSSFCLLDNVLPHRRVRHGIP